MLWLGCVRFTDNLGFYRFGQYLVHSHSWSWNFLWCQNAKEYPKVKTFVSFSYAATLKCKVSKYLRIKWHLFTHDRLQKVVAETPKLQPDWSGVKIAGYHSVAKIFREHFKSRHIVRTFWPPPTELHVKCRTRFTTVLHQCKHTSGHKKNCPPLQKMCNEKWQTERCGHSYFYSWPQCICICRSSL